MPTDFGFTSQRNERGFGLYDYNARYYSAVLGHFVSPDSIVPDEENPQHWNRYSYVYDNPLKYTDPSGHIECTGGVSSTMKRTYCIGGGTIEIGSTGGGSGLEVAAMFLMALTIKLVQNNIALDDVEVPTDSGGYGNDQGSQFPAYEEVPLDGPIDDGVLPNVPPKVGPTHSPGFSLEEPGAFGDGILQQSSVPLHEGQQGKHIPGHNNYIPGRSILTHPDPQALLNQHASTGATLRGTPGQPGFKELISDFGEEIGFHVDATTGVQTPTHSGVIHYGKKGAHIVPIKPQSP